MQPGWHQTLFWHIWIFKFLFVEIQISFSPQELQSVTRAWRMYRWKQNILSLRKPDGVYSSGLVAGRDCCLYWPWQLTWSPFSLLLYWVEMSFLAGRIICVERTVLLLQKPLLCSAAGADLSELTGPVRLDELDSTTQASSICALRGLYGLAWNECS